MAPISRGRPVFSSTILHFIILITMHFRTLSRFLFMSLCSFFSCSTPEGLSSLSAGEFSTLLSQKPDLILLDVRTPSEYA